MKRTFRSATSFRSVSFTLAGSFALLALACVDPPSPAKQPGPDSVTAVTAVVTSPTATPRSPTEPPKDQPNARIMPKVDNHCVTDADCVLVERELVDAPLHHTFACCPSCASNAVARSWVPTFDLACAATPAPMCPPLGCVHRPMHPACESGLCVANH